MQVVERAATPRISEFRRRLIRATQALTSPLLPGDYVALINPLWSTRGLRGRSFALSQKLLFMSAGAGQCCAPVRHPVGHPSITVTLDRHGHLMPGNEKEAAEMLAAYL